MMLVSFCEFYSNCQIYL